MNEPAHGPTGLPQLRTLLLTDLCDSTTLVERLGDSPAAGLFQAHDRLVLQLQQRWRGRLIDRSDGLLLLFERPIDGLGFALDYARGLLELGRPYDVKLQARAGLHVGEVLTWRNSDEAVQVGAKPLEVEGLAKPMAGRLMSLARPGQILISAVAEPLASRSARELGERGEQLLWKSHGRWCFKGVPGCQEIFEVGEAGVAPLRAPAATAKAWRDIPLWRRPAALAAELALVAGLGGGLWFATRPQPAIAFGERDWVVVGDLRNLTGDKLLDDSLEQAFRISLEQSRYVNVLSDLKARETLQRMRRGPDTPLDRAVASEIALREGARAVLLPTVAEVGGRVRVSVELVDPRTQATVFAASEDGNGARSALASIDAVAADLRGELGEALQSIQRDSIPLPDVTAGNLDALRAYALAQDAYAHTEFKDALQLFERATALEPQFALAWLGQVRANYARERAPAALAALRRAQALRANLPPREALYLDAWVAEFDAPVEVTRKWVELSRLYPDYMPARGNAALWLYKDNRFSEALVHAQAASTPRNPMAATEFDSIGRAQLGLEQYDLAEAAFRQSYARTGGSLRRLVATAAARRDYASAARYAKDLEADNPFAYLEQASVAVDRGQWAQARSLAQVGLAATERYGGVSTRYMGLPLAVSHWLAGDDAAARNQVRDSVERSIAALAQPATPDAEEDAAVVLGGAVMALRWGDDALVAKGLAAVQRHPEMMQLPYVQELAGVIRAEQLRRAGKAKDAIPLLQRYLNGQERYQTRVALMDAYADAGNDAAALEQARWLQAHRGRAFVELMCGHCLQALNVADSNVAILREAEMLARLGQRAAAAQALRRFDQQWPIRLLPAQLRSRRVALKSVSSLGAV